MILSSNYNVLQITASAKGQYNKGDKFVVPERHKYKFARFDGLEIKEITYGFGIFLHFDWSAWDSIYGMARETE